MPTYDYRCPEGHEFEEMNSVANRHKAECFYCGKMADKVIINAPGLDPKMGLDPDFPTAAARFRERGERRARGRDMTAANKTVSDDIARDAYNVRKALGETNVTVS